MPVPSALNPQPNSLKRTATVVIHGTHVLEEYSIRGLGVSTDRIPLINTTCRLPRAEETIRPFLLPKSLSHDSATASSCRYDRTHITATVRTSSQGTSRAPARG